MRVVLAGLFAIAAVVVIAAGGTWLWQQYARPEPVALPLWDASKCGDYIVTLQRAASAPDTVTSAEKNDATQGRIDCLDHGVN